MTNGLIKFLGLTTLLGMSTKEKEPYPVLKEPDKRTITFRADDNTWKRAENIYHGMGFCNDPGGMVAKIAGFLSMYKEWDDAKRSK